VVTERDLKGQVVWKYEIPTPVMAHRLANGNTFITARGRIVEVDKDGKKVFEHTDPNGREFMRGQKLRNGEMICVTEDYQYHRLDATGKEVGKSFPVDIRTFGGRLQLLPNGRLLVPEYTNRRVAELDGDGKVVWEAPFEIPIAAVRLPDGNTLVTGYQQHRAVELDPAGQTVWEYQASSRVTRAWRR
jgi:outer membrane protein assembly factor BamB